MFVFVRFGGGCNYSACKAVLMQDPHLPAGAALVYPHPSYGVHRVTIFLSQRATYLFLSVIRLKDQRYGHIEM
jgi:hypothetical protein